MTFDEFAEFAHCLADAADAETLPRFRQPIGIDHKDGKGFFDPVTDADRRAEAAIRALIDREYPDHAILGEEYGITEGTSGHEWVIDPIDGTRSYIGGIPLWTTIIGLKIDGVPAFGMVTQPFTGERFWGGAGTARMSTRGEERAISTRDCASLDTAILMTTTPFLFDEPDLRERYQAVEGACRLPRYGGDGYAYCMIAAGQIDLVVEAGLAPYDIVGLIPVIEAAGGLVTTWDNGPAGNGGRIVAAGDAWVHAEARALLSDQS